MKNKKFQIKTLNPWVKFPNLEKELQNSLTAEGFESAEIQDILSKVKKLFPQLNKWYESVNIEWSIPRKKYKIRKVKMSKEEIGEGLEDLVHAALQSLGCKVDSSEIIILNAPCEMKNNGIFKGKKFVFKRHFRTRDMVDFEGQNINIAIEVKNWDPKIPKSDHVVLSEICKRFKKVRKKIRYLLIPGAPGGFPFTNKQRQILKQRRIKEINLKEQLRWNNEKTVYKDVYSKMRQILSIC